jgi:hypothetical protein
LSQFVGSASDERTVNNDVRHQYRVLTEEEKKAMIKLKDAGLAFITLIKETVPLGRESLTARDRVEEAVMWAVKGLTA